MSSEPEENINFFEAAQMANEEISDALSSLMLILISLYEQDKKPAKNLKEMITNVISCAGELANVAIEIAEADYKDDEEAFDELTAAANEVQKGIKEVTQSTKLLDSQDKYRQGYQDLSEGCRLIGSNCIQLLHTVYGVGFKVFPKTASKAKETLDDITIEKADEDFDKFNERLNDLVQNVENMAEDMNTMADTQASDIDKQRMKDHTKKLREQNEILTAATNELLDEPEDSERKEKFKKAKSDLSRLIDEANEMVNKAYDDVKVQQAMTSPDDIQTAKIEYTKEETKENGLKTVEALDYAEEAVFWDDPEETQKQLQELNKLVPKVVDGLAQNVTDPEKEKKIRSIESDYKDYREQCKNDLASGEKEKSIDKYKKLREKVVNELVDFGVDPDLFPKENNFDDLEEAKQEEESEAINDVDEVKKNMKLKNKDDLDQVLTLAQLLDEMEYARDSSDVPMFKEAANDYQKQAQAFANEKQKEALRDKDPKKRKIAENLGQVYVDVVKDNMECFKDKNNPQKKQQAKNSGNKVKEVLKDYLVSQGSTPTQANFLLENEDKSDLLEQAKEQKREDTKELAEALSEEGKKRQKPNQNKTIRKTTF